MKSKMPCPPGFVPVAKVDHATGVCAGVVVATRENAPSARSRWRFGSSPAASIVWTIVGSSPSSPITITFFKARPSRDESSLPRQHTPVIRHSFT